MTTSDPGSFIKMARLRPRRPQGDFSETVKFQQLTIRSLLPQLPIF